MKNVVTDQMLSDSWSEWAAWSPCSVSCDEGEQIRTRSCLDSVVGCEGNEIEKKPCFDVDCPGLLRKTCYFVQKYQI